IPGVDVLANSVVLLFASCPHHFACVYQDRFLASGDRLSEAPRTRRFRDETCLALCPDCCLPYILALFSRFCVLGTDLVAFLRGPPTEDVWSHGSLYRNLPPWIYGYQGPQEPFGHARRIQLD